MLVAYHFSLSEPVPEMLDVLCVSFRNDLARLVIVVFGIVLVLGLVRVGEPAPPSPYSAVDPDPVADGVEVFLKVFESADEIHFVFL